MAKLPEVYIGGYTSSSAAKAAASLSGTKVSVSGGGAGGSSSESKTSTKSKEPEPVKKTSLIKTAGGQWVSRYGALGQIAQFQQQRQVQGQQGYDVKIGGKSYSVPADKLQAFLQQQKEAQARRYAKFKYKPTEEELAAVEEKGGPVAGYSYEKTRFFPETQLPDALKQFTGTSQESSLVLLNPIEAKLGFSLGSGLPKGPASPLSTKFPETIGFDTRAYEQERAQRIQSTGGYGIGVSSVGENLFTQGEHFIQWLAPKELRGAVPYAVLPGRAILGIRTFVVDTAAEVFKPVVQGKGWGSSKVGAGLVFSTVGASVGQAVKEPLSPSGALFWGGVGLGAFEVGRLGFGGKAVTSSEGIIKIESKAPSETFFRKSGEMVKGETAFGKGSIKISSEISPNWPEVLGGKKAVTTVAKGKFSITSFEKGIDIPTSGRLPNLELLKVIKQEANAPIEFGGKMGSRGELLTKSVGTEKAVTLKPSPKAVSEYHTHPSGKNFPSETDYAHFEIVSQRSISKSFIGSKTGIRLLEKMPNESVKIGESVSWRDAFKLAEREKTTEGRIMNLPKALTSTEGEFQGFGTFWGKRVSSNAPKVKESINALTLSNPPDVFEATTSEQIAFGNEGKFEASSKSISEKSAVLNEATEVYSGSTWGKTAEGKAFSMTDVTTVFDLVKAKELRAGAAKKQWGSRIGPSGRSMKPMDFTSTTEQPSGGGASSVLKEASSGQGVSDVFGGVKATHAGVTAASEGLSLEQASYSMSGLKFKEYTGGRQGDFIIQETRGRQSQFTLPRFSPVISEKTMIATDFEQGTGVNPLPKTSLDLRQEQIPLFESSSLLRSEEATRQETLPKTIQAQITSQATLPRIAQLKLQATGGLNRFPGREITITKFITPLPKTGLGLGFKSRKKAFGTSFKAPGFNFGGKKRLLADLVSVTVSQARYGRATHPLGTKANWAKARKSLFLNVPTTEMLETKKTKVKHKKIRR